MSIGLLRTKGDDFIKKYFTEKKYKELLDHFVILIDTREQTNEHIIKYFEDNNINYKQKSLKTGDYSFMITSCQEYGFELDTYFTDEICIERKNSVDEIAGNISNSSKDDDRIFKEFNRMININRNYVLIENDTVDNIIYGKYKSNLNSDSFLRTLLTWQSRNNMHLYFVSKNNIGKFIYELCKNCLDSNILK